ncbi:carboxymuconolactone decarboxylase family protein [Mycobacterium sp. Aquia_216]|uniref:carboxymuconolactone decarboxylase family protein n=1 Tax=Mycobacterium sp. Aquia_216 TaxID=2991729 RepID=UPI00227AEB6B|nr:carboxymuconolactone decarboxylase family protein [Mycobacterium sp. Aquia_216]WAJ45590.1 carboxymuconolactone decarboxylase family protein [Mycobacterium sp. Aquia_216]
MARLLYPDRTTFPQQLQDFLAEVPEHLNFDMMSYSQSTIEAFILQGQAHYTGLELPSRTRELVILTTAAAADAEYEFVQHVPISEAMGVDPQIREEIHRLDLDAPVLSAHDRAVTKFVAAVVHGPPVDDDIFGAVHEILSSREVVEVLQVIGYYWSFGRVATVLQVEVEQAHGIAVVDASEKGSRDELGTGE